MLAYMVLELDLPEKGTGRAWSEVLRGVEDRMAPDELVHVSHVRIALGHDGLDQAVEQLKAKVTVSGTG